MALTPYEGAEVDTPKLTPYTGEEVDPKAGPSRLRRLVADPAISALKGAIGLPEAAVGIADIATGGVAGKAAETIGFRPKEAKATLDTLYSPEQKAANQAVADAEGFLPTVGAALRNPSTIAHTVIESAPSILGGAGVARGLVRAGMGAATAAGIGEGVVSAGATAESIRQESENGLLTGRQAAIAAGSGVLTSTLGVAGGRLAKRFGVTDIDTVLAGGADDAVRINPVKALAAGAVTEGVFEEMPQSAQEQVAQNLATGKPVAEGVSKAAATGMLAGGVMGGGVASVKNLLAKSVGVSETRERIEAIPELPAEEQKPAAAELAAAVHPESVQAAVQMEAEVLDRLDAGEAVLESAPEPAAPTKEALVEALQEAVASGGELNPVEALQGKEERQVLEALRKERPLAPEVAPEVVPAATPEIRAQRWLTEGKTITKEGSNPDPEVAALLDDMGYTLTQGERADRKQGGSIARREWLVEKKAATPLIHPEVGMGQGSPEWGSYLDLAKAEIARGNFDAVTTKKGEKLRLVHTDDGQGIQSQVLAFNDAGELVGDMLYSKATMDDGRGYNPNVYVEEAMRRKGVASVLYDAAEAQGGKIPALDQHGQLRSDEGQAFRNARAGVKPASKPALTPIKHKEQRQAFPDNPNLKVARENDAILIYDDAAFTRAKDMKDQGAMKESILGMARIKDGKFDGWVEGREPLSPQESVEYERVLKGHLGEVRFSRSPFRSKLADIVSAKMGGRMPVAQLLSMLKSNGVTDAEMDTVLGSLRDSGGAVTKQQVQDEIKANSVEFEDVVLGEPSFDVEAWWNDEGGANEETPFADLSPAEQREATARYQEEVGDYADDRTHFSQYTEPGAVEGSYREMFVTAPDTKSSGAAKTLRADLDKLLERLEDLNPLSLEYADTQQRIYEAQDELDEMEGYGENVTPDSWSDGHSQYSEIQNPVVRIRFNEREAEGKRVLFVEEMQGPSDANQKKMPEYLKKRIYDIGVKRVLAYAKENGFDGIAWTTGEMQAKRYDLAKQVDKIEYWDQVATASASGKQSRAVNIDMAGGVTQSVEVDRASGEVLWAYGKSSLVGKRLDEVVGKELAKKIIEPSEGGEISGEGLSVGGEGLKALYDRTLPALFKKYGKEGTSRVEINNTDDRPLYMDQKYTGPDATIEQVRAAYKASQASGANIWESPVTGARMGYPLNRVANEQGLRAMLREMEDDTPFATAIVMHGADPDIFGGKIESIETPSMASVPFIPITAKTPESYPAFKRGQSQGIPAAEITAHLAPVTEKLKVPVQVVSGASEIPGLDTDVEFTGVFLNGKIYLNAANLSSLEEAEAVLLQHEIRHAGLRAIFDRKGLDALLAKTWGDLNSGVKAFAQERGIDTRSRDGKLEAAEEYIVELAKTEAQSPVWDRFVALFKALLRRVGLNLKLSDTELRWLVARSGEIIVEGALPGETGSRFAAAWHGTPHKFDKFSLSKIGTGEGAQAYGYGLYFAGSKAVAEYYREALRPNTPRSWRTTIAGVNIRDYPDAPGGLPMAKIGTALEAAGTVQGAIAEIENAAWATGEGGIKVQAKALEFLRTLPPDGEVVIEPVPDGHLYQVELAPDEDEYLRWDLSLGEQSKKIQDILEKAGYWDEETDGQTLYNLLKRQQNGDREASEHLHSLGIRGIKFPDGPSRNRPLKDIKAAFLAQLPEDAEFDDVTEMLGTGAFSAEQERLIRALEADDWLGFDYPAQAISAAMGKNLRGFDPSPELAAAVADLGKDMTYNYVIFNDEDVEIKARFARLSPKEIVTEVASRTELKIAKRVLSDVSGNVWYAVLPIDRAITFAQSLPLYDPLKKHLGDLLIHRRAKRAAANDPADAAYKLLRRVSTAFEDPYRTKIGGVFSHFTREGRAQADAAITTFNDLTSLATLYELRADGGLDGWTETSWKDQGKLKQTGKTLGQAQTEIKSLWAKLSKEQRIVQQEMIDHIKVVSDEVREARLIPYRQTFGEKMFAEAEAVAKQILTLDSKARVELKAATDGRVHRLALQIAEIRAERGLKGDFAPLMRFGDHVVRTFKGGKRIKTEIFESKLLAEKAAEKIKATPGLTTSYEKLSRQEKGTVNIPLDFMEDLRAAAEARGIKGDDLAALMDDFQAARVQTMPRATIAGNKLHREGVEGYSTDMLRAYAAYVSSAGRAIAQLKYGTKIEQTFRDMDNAIKAYQDPEGRWSVHAVERMSALKDRLYKMERMAATEKINEITKFLGKSTFLWFLTSPSVYAVQWAQPFMVTIPKMAARYGFSTAFKAYISEAKRFMAGEFSDEKIDAFNTLHENAGERLYQLIQEEREALPSEREGLRKAMMALYNGFDEKGKKLLILKVLGLQGELDLSLSHSMQDFVAGYAPSIGNPGETGFSAFHKAGNKITDQVMSKGAFFMQKSETGSRRAAAVSAFQLALGKKSDFAEANAYAADIISDTLGDFDSQNRPALMRGNVGRIIGQFQFFRLHMLGKVAQLFKDAHGAEFTRRIDAAKKSMKGQGFNVQTASANGVAQFRIMRAGESYFSTQKRETQPAEVQAFFNEIEEASRGKAEARKELSYMIGMSMALAGAGGTPIALAFSNSATSLIFSALALAFGDPDDPWEPEQEFHAAVREAMGDTMGNAFLMGLPSLVGMDVSKRIGMGGFADVLSGEPPPGISGTQKAQWYASRMLGPSFGLFSDSMRAFDALADGDLGEAMAVSSPKVVKDFIKATQLSEKGVTGIGGKTVIQPDDVAVTSLALQMVGINPAEVALAQQERREVAALSASLRTRRSLLMKRVTEATLDGDFEAREEALGAINEWGTKQPALMVTQKELLAAVKKGMRMRAGMLTAKEEMMQEKVRGL